MESKRCQKVFRFCCDCPNRLPAQLSRQISSPLICGKDLQSPRALGHMVFLMRSILGVSVQSTSMLKNFSLRHLLEIQSVYLNLPWDTSYLHKFLMSFG